MTTVLRATPDSHAGGVTSGSPCSFIPVTDDQAPRSGTHRAEGRTR